MASEHARHWRLDPGVVFLNHGSFGACPAVVLEEQVRLRERMEAEPVRFFVRELPRLLDGAREALAAFVGAAPSDLAFVKNATTGVNAVLRSLSFGPGDELLTTDHEYNACRNALEFVARRTGARVVVAPVPFPLAREAQVLEALTARASPRTRLLLVDAITSQTGLVFPLARIVEEFNARGVDVLVDGAHAPGMIPLDLNRLGAAYFTGNCHKWLCAPKGAALLWVRPDRQAGLHPLAISHGFNAPQGARSQFQVEFDWTGTDDPSAFLCVPAALQFLSGLLPGGVLELMRRNRDLALQGRRILCSSLKVAPPAPEAMIGSLASVPLPDGSSDPPKTPLYQDPLQDRLVAEHHIEVPVIPWPWPPKRLLRISSQIYNTLEQIQFLSDCLGAILR